MRIIKVIVDELPNGCKDCILGDDEYGICCANGRQLEDRNYQLQDWRPDWCPLITKDKYSLALKACLDLVNDMEKIDFDSLRATWERAFFAIGYIDQENIAESYQ